MRLLVVEDDPQIAGIVREGLELERHKVDVATDGQRAIELGSRSRHDLIVLDLLLPGRSGVEVCRQLRERGVRTPILMLSAMDSVEDRVRGLEAGADDYLGKPFAIEELVARVNALLRRAGFYATPTLQLGDLLMDRSTHEVRRAGKLIQLTAKEFALLEYLMVCAGRVVTRSMIEEQVWGYQDDPLTNVVSVYIGRLRQKLDQGYARPLFHTVRGVGYRLKP